MAEEQPRPTSERDRNASVESLLQQPFGFSPSELLFVLQEDGRFAVLLRLRDEVEGEFDGRTEPVYRQREIGSQGSPLTADLIYPLEDEITGIGQGDIGLIPLLHKNTEIILGDPRKPDPNGRSLIDIVTYPDGRFEATGYGGENEKIKVGLRGSFPPIPVVVGSDPMIYQYGWGTGDRMVLDKGLSANGISDNHFVMFVAHNANGLRIPHLYVEPLSPHGTFIRAGSQK